jgi:hypothetical protein
MFGCHDCMGKVRSYLFEAVIGVGGKRPDRHSEDLARKINWIGIGPTRITVPPNVRRNNGEEFRGPWVTFECFRLWEERGPDMNEVAPKLFRRMFVEKQVRHVMSQSLTRKMQDEVKTILDLVNTFKPGKRSGIFEKTCGCRICRRCEMKGSTGLIAPATISTRRKC